jgi:hypothetical protein
MYDIFLPPDPGMKVPLPDPGDPMVPLPDPGMMVP